MSVDHRQLGVDLFNRTWTFLDKDERMPDEDDAMSSRGFVRNARRA